MTEERTFSIGEVAKIFEKSVPWLRWREKTPVFVDAEGRPIEVKRTSPRRARAGYRKYTLQNIQDLADSLLRSGKMSQEDYDKVKARVDAFRL